MQLPSDRLALLYRVTQAFNSSLELGQVLSSVMDEVIAATHAERGFIMLRDSAGRLDFRAARGIDQQTIGAPEFQVSRSVVERVTAEGRPLLASNAQSDAWLGGRASVLSLGLRSILCVPLLLKSSTLGAIYVDNRLQAGVFSQADLELLSAIASSAAIALENARLYEMAVEKGRMERELQVAHELQSSLIPRSTPSIAGWDVAAMWLPALEVAGDFYDFAQWGRRFGFTIGDVCGKGMPAALFMALSRTVLRSCLSHAAAPARGMEKANRLIHADAHEGMFVTVCHGLLDTASGELTIINAGHNRPLVYQCSDDRLNELEQRGMALGIEPSLHVLPSRVQLAAGDFVLLYTDGVTEAAGAGGEQFGVERLRHVLLSHKGEAAGTIVAALQHALRDFIGAMPQYDDITVVLVKR